MIDDKKADTIEKNDKINDIVKRKKRIFCIFTISILFILCFIRKNLIKEDFNEIVIPSHETTVVEENKFVEFNILGKNIIRIDMARFDSFGTGRLENRWELEETDLIFESLKGVWKIESYVGFVDSSLFDPDLFDKDDNLDVTVKKELYDTYLMKLENAKDNIPEIYFSVREQNGNDTNKNYIYSGTYSSPVSITLSLDRLNDYYPLFADQNAISMDFNVKYPVMYIRFALDVNNNLKSATLVLDSDNKIYILMEGAFYSLKRSL